MAEFRRFRDAHVQQWQQLERRWNLAWWESALSGREEDFNRTQELEIEVRRLHSDRESFQLLKQMKESGAVTDPVLARSLDLLFLAFAENQIEPELMERMVGLQTDLEQAFNTFRPRVNGETVTANRIREVLSDSDDSTARRTMWEASKEVGSLVAGRLVELAIVRNEAAVALGYENYYEMMLAFREQEPDQIEQVFEELAQLTDAPFRAVRAELDRRLGERFNLPPEELQPWHMADPFFQESPGAAIDLDRFFAQEGQNHVVDLATAFFQGIGLPVVEEILRRSDLYEREGKVEHAFCTHIDRAGDVRVLTNLRNTERWMSILLHELGHAVYDAHIDRSLPFELREPGHIFATEGVAELFGTLTGDPRWLRHHRPPSVELPENFDRLVREEHRIDLLVFARWTLVMVNFERQFYANPEQNLNDLWWRLVERYQGLRRPPGRSQVADFAAKIHFVVAPVYYHNYMLGRMYAAQLRHRLAVMVPDAVLDGSLDMYGQAGVGRYLVEHVFRPGSLHGWSDFVQRSTGEPLTARYFAEAIQSLPAPPEPPAPPASTDDPPTEAEQ
jgi:peptidyl-dipeptidase A